MQKLDLKNLKPGTKVEVKTKNSTYIFTKLEAEILGKGGSYLLEEQKVLINGSTWGGNAIVAGSIVVGMRMELITEKDRLSTSKVKSIKIIETSCA